MIKAVKERMIGIVRTPTDTLGEVMSQKRWQVAFTVLLLVAFILSFLSAPIVMKANFEKNPDLYASFPGDGDIGIVGQVLMGLSAVFVYVLRLILVTFFIYLFYTIFGAEGLFVNYFALVTNASLVTIMIPEIFKSLYLLISGTIINPFNLTLLFDFSERASWSFYILSVFDLFQIWFILMIAFGVFGFFKKTKEKWEEARFSLKKSFMIATAYFAFKSVVIILFSYLFGKLAMSMQQMLINS